MSSTAQTVFRVLAVVIGGFMLFFAFVAGSFIGWSSEPLGWLWSAIAFALVLSFAIWLWRPRDRRRPLAAAVVAALLLGFGHWQSSPPTHDRIAEQADEVTVPTDWELESESTMGNTWCWKGCPTVERDYLAPGSYDDAVAAASSAFEDAGWKAGTSGSSDDATFSDGRWRARLSDTNYDDEGPTRVTLSFSG